MKTGINYIILLISMLCLPVEYVVAGNNAEVTSQSCGWLVEKTNHGENHPNYDRQVKAKILSIINSAPNNDAAYARVIDFVNTLKQQLINDVIRGSYIVNDVVIP